MNWSDLAFFGCALLAIISAMVLINQRQPVYAALAMLSMFLGLTGIFTLLNASFVAAMQIMVYGGAVIVVFLFVIMLLNYHPEELPQEKETGFKLFVAIACALLAVGLGTLVGLGSIREASNTYNTVALIQARQQAAGLEPIAPGAMDDHHFLPLDTLTLTQHLDANAQEIAVAQKDLQTLKDAKGPSLQAAQTKLTRLEAERDQKLKKSRAAELEFGSTKGVGQALFNLHMDKDHTRYTTSYMVPFELLSLLIVAAMLGAVVLSKPRLMLEPVTAIETDAATPTADEHHKG